MDAVLERLQEWAALYGLKIIGAVLIFLIGRFVAGLMRKVARRIMEKSKVDAALVSFVESLVYIGLMTFVIIAALGRLGIQTASFIAVLGAAGLAIGLALQGSLANFAAGVLMLIFKPFKVGDFIDAAGVTGVVEHIEIFTTQLKTPDNKKVIIPNAKITGDCITNFSANDTRRVDMTVGVSYSEDLSKVKETVEAVLAEDDRILKDPEPTVGVLELADSSINFVVRPWVKTADYWNVFFDTQKKLKERFDAVGISIPFPQRDVHLFQEQQG